MAGGQLGVAVGRLGVGGGRRAGGRGTAGDGRRMAGDGRGRPGVAGRPGRPIFTKSAPAPEVREHLSDICWPFLTEGLSKVEVSALSDGLAAILK